MKYSCDHGFQSAPPSYDFTAIRNVSIHLFYSSNDNVATADDVEKEMIGKQLGKDVVKVSGSVRNTNLSRHWWESTRNEDDNLHFERYWVKSIQQKLFICHAWSVLL